AVVGVDLPDGGRRVEELAEAHGELIERGTEDDGDIGLPNPLHRSRSAEPAGDSVVEFGLREEGAAQSRRRWQATWGGSELVEFGRGSGQPGAAAGEEERTLRRGELLCQTVERDLGEFGIRSQGSGACRTGDLGDGADVDGGDI